MYLGRRGERHLRFENNALLIAIVAAGIAAEWALVWSLGSAVIALNVIPVVVVSGSGKMDDVIQVMRNRAVDYLRKPFRVEQLGAALDRPPNAFGKLTR